MDIPSFYGVSYVLFVGVFSEKIFFWAWYDKKIFLGLINWTRAERSIAGY